MGLTMQNKHVPVFHEEGFPPPAEISEKCYIHFILPTPLGTLDKGHAHGHDKDSIWPFANIPYTFT